MLPSPPLVYYGKIDEYKKHYEENYCKKPILTFDNIPIFFPKNKFEHAFFESSKRNKTKDLFSKKRAQRINWIKEILINPSLTYQGWDSKKKVYNSNRRVAIVWESFVVVVQISLKKNKSIKGNFVTAYLADNSISKIRNSPNWERKDFLK